MKQTVSPWRQLLFRDTILAVIVICGGTFINALNIFIVPPALPTIVEDIGGIDYYALTVTMSVMASILGSAYVTKIFRSLGARNSYVISLGLFVLGSLLCAMATAMPTMIVGRALQGFGGGMLVALSYVLLRITIDRNLWSRMMGLTTSMWGLATLVGPAVGGMLAEIGAWRMIFWLLIPAAGLVALGAIRAFPRHQEDDSNEQQGFATYQLLVLTGAICLFSVSGLVKDVSSIVLLFTGGVVLMLAFGSLENRLDIRLLPKGAVDISSTYGLTFAAVALVSIVAVWSNVFVSLFLQTIHGQSPLVAGYIAALIAGGWTVGSFISAGMHGRGIQMAVLTSPLIMLLSSILLAAIIPVTDSSTYGVALISLGVFFMGAGPGMAWPHLTTWIMGDAPEGEGDTASGSIVLVQNAAMAIGAALAGLIANSTGLITPGGIEGASQAAQWVYGLLAIPALSGVICVIWLIRRRTDLA